MTVHIALSGLHLRRPPWFRVPQVVRHAANPVAAAGWLTAGANAVDAGYGKHLACVVLIAAAYLVGAYRAGRCWRARFELFAAGIQAGNRALGQQLAHYERVWAERSAVEAAERNSLPGQHINPSYANAYVSNERGGR